ncbi:protein psiN [Hyalella azteca]|uniref:Protein psiN n=1 Tax=Hyalella azteca TaxID=294128 RepID=A0A8B7NY00_HYAAZ|nr:protein psiN [Hyalella azteca]
MQLDIIMVLLLVAGLASGLPPIGNATLCLNVGNGEQRCGSCLQPVECQGQAPNDILNHCYPGTVCEQIKPNQVSCVPIASATACQCTSDKCDDYDAQFTVTCDASVITDVVDCTAGEQCVENGICSACAGTTGTVDFFVDQQCRSRYRCNGGVFYDAVNCAEGEYVSKDGTCSQAPPTPCAEADKCTVGFCPDLTNCTRYYICDPNQEPSATGPFSCPSNQCFDYNTNTCGPGCNCDPWTDCDFTSAVVTTSTSTTSASTTIASTTTVSLYTPPPNCDASSVGNFPYGPCDPHYWACRQGSGTSYVVVEMQCPNGLVFSTNLDYPYCVDPSEEPTCLAYAAEH